MPAMRTLPDILEEYEFLDSDERYRLLIELGRELEDMPQPLKTDATLVRGCSAQVWVYPTGDAGKLHFLADSNAAITKGIVALVIAAVQDRPAAEVAEWTWPPPSPRLTSGTSCLPTARRGCPT
jgi:cysteine desulfuration protein SufE